MNWLDLCRDRACIACGKNDGTVVPAHSNQQAHGKGMAQKAGDWTVIPLCRACHEYMDVFAEREEERQFWLRNWVAHHMSLCQAEMIAPVGEKTRERVFRSIPKILPRRA